MRLFFIVVYLLFINTAKLQYSIPAKIISEQEIEYPSTDIEAFNVCIFPEEPSVDLEKWVAYLNDSLVLDDASMDTIPAGRYTVIVRFEVGERGKLNNITILKEPGYGLGERVKKTISNSQGIWKPVIEKNGKITRNYRIQPITFLVEEECEELPAEIIL